MMHVSSFRAIYANLGLCKSINGLHGLIEQAYVGKISSLIAFTCSGMGSNKGSNTRLGDHNLTSTGHSRNYVRNELPGVPFWAD